MADDTKNSRITNADTLARRAWIESAMRSVRLHLNASAFVPPSEAEADVGTEAAAPEPAFEARSERRKHGHLYMAWSEGERRSGT
jgi:hypothetical protein